MHFFQFLTARCPGNEIVLLPPKQEILLSRDLEVIKRCLLNPYFSNFTARDFKDTRYTEVLLFFMGVAFSHMKWVFVLPL